MFNEWFNTQRKKNPTLTKANALAMYKKQNSYESGDPEFEKMWKNSDEQYRLGDRPIYTKSELHNQYLNDKNRRLPNWKQMEMIFKNTQGEDKWNAMSSMEQREWYNQNYGKKPSQPPAQKPSQPAKPSQPSQPPAQKPVKPDDAPERPPINPVTPRNPIRTPIIKTGNELIITGVL